MARHLISKIPLCTPEDCKRQLKRIAWRLQYRSKQRLKKEMLVSDEFSFKIQDNSSLEDHSLANLWVSELLDRLSTQNERYVIQKIYLEGYGEKDVARMLNISQQAVNKWKRKALSNLKRTMISRPC